MGRLIEGLWDCQHCDTKGNKGSIRECPNCGHPRDDSVKFYMPGTITYVSEEKARTINKNPDWVCLYCNTLNSDDNTICKSCGANKADDSLDYFENQRNKKEKESSYHTHSSDSESNYEDSYEEDYEENTSYNYNSSSYNSNYYSSNTVPENKIITFLKDNWKFLLIIPVIIALIVGGIYLFTPKEEYVTITDFKWEYSVNIEKFETIKDSGWSLPSDARLLYTNNEISHYDQVLDHYETKTRQVAKTRISHYESYVSGYRDLGNGYFEEIIDQRPVYETYYETETYEEPVYRSVPIYDTKYYYERDVWNYNRTIKFNGSDKDPKWGEIKLNDLERISESSRSKKYYVIGINSKNETKEYEFSYEEWKPLEINQVIKFEKSLFEKSTIIEVITSFDEFN